MTPLTHGISGMIVGKCALEVFPEFAKEFTPFSFYSLCFLLGQLPDIDCLLSLVVKKLGGANPLWKHRGFGHSFFAHVIFSSFLPLLILQEFDSADYVQWALFIFAHLAVHFVEDMLDGSVGIYYLAPFYKKPIKLFSLVHNVDDAILHFWHMKEKRLSFIQRIWRRIKGECVFNAPLLMILLL